MKLEWKENKKNVFLLFIKKNNVFLFDCREKIKKK